MHSDSVNIYYGISFENLSSKKIKQIEFEILNDELLKKISYYFSDLKNYKISKKIKKLDNSNANLIIEVIEKDDNIFYKIYDEVFIDLKEIIQKYNVVPRFYLNPFNTNEYKNKLVKLEHERNTIKNKQFIKYNKIFNKNFNVLDGINSIYEWYTGAVYFKDYEWEEIKSNPIKKAFESMENNSYIYSLPLDDGIILRGPNIYYYFSSDVSRFEKPTLKQIKTWHENCKCFFEVIEKSLSNYKITSEYDLRLLLGVIDNLRNIILIMFNSELLSIKNGNNIIFQCESSKNNVIEKYIYLTNLYMDTIENICLIRPIKSNIISSIKEIIKGLCNVSNVTMNKVKKITDIYLLSKCFNPLREIDNYFENYITCKFALNKLKEKKLLKDEKIHFIGVLYGGLELPFLLKRQVSREHDIFISLIYQNHGMYLDRQNKNKSVIVNNLIEIGKIDKNITTYIIDDNMMSGITIQFIYNQLYLKKYLKIKGIIAIRHPNINRLPQLEHFNTAVNIDEIDKTIFGMLTDTPYSKIKYNSNYNNMFVNELNIFSIMTEVFLKALYRNNTFIKDSQVDIFLGYSKGKDNEV